MHPDPNTIHFTYDHDPLNRVTAIKENGSATLATFAYDNHGRRGSIARTGSITSYGYDGASRLQSLGHDLVAMAQDLTLDFTYTPASQIRTRTISNNVYIYTGDINVSRPYARNGLNQYTTAGTASFTYLNGNLVSTVT